MEDKNREANILKIKEDLEDALELTQLERKIQDNKIYFTHNKKEFCIGLPTYKEESEWDLAIQIEYKKLINAKDLEGNPLYLFADQWKQIYKERGIDLDEKEEEIKRLYAEVDELLLKLKKIKDEPAIEEIENQINDKRFQIAEITGDIVEKCRFSIQHKLNYFSKIYWCYLLLKVKENEQWIRYFKQFEDLENSSDTRLVKRALVQLVDLIDFPQLLENR